MLEELIVLTRVVVDVLSGIEVIPTDAVCLGTSEEEGADAGDTPLAATRSYVGP